MVSARPSVAANAAAVIQRRAAREGQRARSGIMVAPALGGHAGGFRRLGFGPGLGF